MLFTGLGARSLGAQESPLDKPDPIVEELAFEGATSIDTNELLETLSTQKTRCRVFLLIPLCALTHSHLFEIRHRLDRRELGRDILRVAVFYWLRGFRHVQVDTTVTAKGRGVAVTFNIDEGSPTLIESVALNRPREILSEDELRRWGLPAAGDRIDLTRLDSLAVRVRRELWDRGHGNAEVVDSAFPVDSLRVRLNVLVDAGPITTVDTVVVEGNERVTARTIRRLIGLNQGDIYKRADLLEAQRRVYRSDLFRQTLISAPDSADSAKTVVVSVREAPPRGTQLGIGFNTVEFAQVEGNLTLYNFHGSARRVELQSTVGNLLAKTFYGKSIFGSAAPTGVGDDVDPVFLEPTWRLSAAVSQPWLFSTRNSIGLSVFSTRRSVPNIVIDRGAGASLTFTRTLVRDVPLSFTYRYERARIEAGELYFCVNFGYCRTPTIEALQQSNTLSPFVITMRAERTDDPIAPSTGYTGRLDLEHASAATQSDWRFNRAELEFTPYLKLGRGTLVLRGRIGRINAGSGTNDALSVAPGSEALLHPRTRFFAGGSRSVRGYAEGQLGPRVLTIDPLTLIDTTRADHCTLASITSGACDPNHVPSGEFVPRPVGGNSVLEGTIEYRFPFGKNIGGAVFVDAGTVGGSRIGRLLGARSAITPGIGFRYLSPVGPVRIDLGLRPGREEELPVVTQVLGADSTLQLVELSTPKRYNPTEGPHGFLGGFFSRLQLHLYIGEAY